MRILEYTGLDTAGLQKPYQKVADAIAKGDFRAAQVKKLGDFPQGKFYRARLDGTNRLLFSLLRHGDEVCALMLEVIRNHDYAASRFLRGAMIDDEKIPDVEPDVVAGDARPVSYLHPQHNVIHLLDKPISFDDAQETVFRTPAPLIVVGSAGSGKTALVLERLKQLDGEVLYVTHSAYLASNARDLYYADGFERPDQTASFLSYREFVESIQVPQGREASWRDFAGWFARMRQAYRDLDAHQLFEEFRGVIAAAPEGVLSRAAYDGLGVRQSIFARDQRGAVYDLFEKYQVWLKDSGFFDLNLIAHAWRDRAQPQFDFVVVDEVQDVTPAQLALVLRTLRKPSQFLLCGDSNQIVHPNFFSWSRLRQLFWSDAVGHGPQAPSVLVANFRNGQAVTGVANRLLRIKQQRFGSIDRESNYLVQAQGGQEGAVALVADKDAVMRDLNARIRGSTQFAVLVMRDEDKAEAAKIFSTPLLFSIREAKGLEYENIVLYHFVTGYRMQFSEIADGVEIGPGQDDVLEYRRAKDKSDKSLEVYKFFVNALYVALTRAIHNVYLIESDTRHPLWSLLDLAESASLRVQARAASLEEWQKEARKLELQGKAEQAEAIRATLLKVVPVPWPVFDEPRIREALIKVFHDQVPGSKGRQQLYEIAACHDLPVLADCLARDANFAAASHFAAQRSVLGRKSYAPYASRAAVKEVLRQCERHGLEFRSPMNLTPLMVAGAAGNVALAEALLERGADRTAVDDFGCNALHWAMRAAFRDPAFAQSVFAPLYDLLAPSAVDVSHEERLVRLDRQHSEYFLFQTLWALFAGCFTQVQRLPRGAFETRMILQAWENLPASVLAPQRNQRAHVSSVLSRNEIGRDYAYNRHLFQRVATGWYRFSPRLKVRRGHDEQETWIPVLQALNLPWVAEFADESVWPALDAFLGQGGTATRPAPILFEHEFARREAAARERERAHEEFERFMREWKRSQRPVKAARKRGAASR